MVKYYSCELDKWLDAATFANIVADPMALCHTVIDKAVQNFGGGEGECDSCYGLTAGQTQTIALPTKSGYLVAVDLIVWLDA